MDNAKFSKKSGMTEEQVKDHLDSFEKGSYLVNQYAYDNYVKNKDVLGRYNDGNNYILNSKDMDKLMTESKGDVSYLEEKLGFPKGHFKDGPIYRIDVMNPERNNIRMATGKEIGANEYFNTSFPGGVDPDKVFEKTGSKKIGNKNIPIIDVKDEKYRNNIHSDYIDAKTGQRHRTSLEGYEGKTSGGYREAVVDCMINDNKNVRHRVYETKKDPSRPADRLINERNDEAKLLIKNYAPKGKDGLTDYQRKERAFKEEIRNQNPKVSNKDVSEATKNFQEVYVKSYKNNRSYDTPEGKKKFKDMDAKDIIKIDPDSAPQKVQKPLGEIKRRSLNEWKDQGHKRVEAAPKTPGFTEEWIKANKDLIENSKVDKTALPGRDRELMSPPGLHEPSRTKKLSPPCL